MFWKHKLSFNWQYPFARPTCLAWYNLYVYFFMSDLQAITVCSALSDTPKGPTANCKPNGTWVASDLCFYVLLEPIKYLYVHKNWIILWNKWKLKLSNDLSITQKLFRRISSHPMPDMLQAHANSNFFEFRKMKRAPSFNARLGYVRLENNWKIILFQ